MADQPSERRVRQKQVAHKIHRKALPRKPKDTPQYPDPLYFHGRPEPRFHSKMAQHLFETFEFHFMDCRYLNRQFFQSTVPHIYDRILYYQLENLVNCTSNISLDLCKEFYVNLRPKDITNSHYVSTAAGTHIEFSPETIRSFLGLRTSSNPFVCFPDVTGKITGSFSNVTIEQIHKYYFKQPRKPTRSTFHATKMSADHYVWYRIILDCILPIVTKGRAMIRIPHLIMMYALEQHLDIDIALHIYHSILYHSNPTNDKIYMPFGHIITQFLAFQGVDITVGAIRQLSMDYDQLGPRHLKLARIVYSNGAMTWIKKTTQVIISSDSEEKDASDDERLTRMESMISDVDGRVKVCLTEIHALRQEVRNIARRQEEGLAQQQFICDMVHKMHMHFQSPPPAADE